MDWFLYRIFLICFKDTLYNKSHSPIHIHSYKHFFQQVLGLGIDFNFYISIYLSAAGWAHFKQFIFSLISSNAVMWGPL